MPFRVTSPSAGDFSADTEAQALTAAVRRVVHGTEDAQVWHDGNLWWSVYRDSKVDESDPYFPAVVTRSAA